MEHENHFLILDASANKFVKVNPMESLFSADLNVAPAIQ